MNGTNIRIEKPWVITSLRVPYGHTDQMGHVYYGNYLLYFEMSRTEWMRAAGITYRSFEEQGFITPVLESHAFYKGRVKYDDQIEIKTGCSSLGKARFRFDYEIRRAGEDQLLTTGWTTHLVVDTQTGRPTRMPQVLRDILEEIGELDEKELIS